MNSELAKDQNESKDEENQVFVLVICNVIGEFRKAFTKVIKAHEKVANLDVFVIGDFFSQRFPVTAALIDAVVSEGNKLPCPVNLLLSKKEAEYLGENKDQLGDNIHVSSGINWLKTISGVSVIYWTESVNKENESEMTAVLNDALTRLAASKCDLLLTASFPTGVFNFTQDPFGSAASSSLVVSKLAKAVCPRYHFCPNQKGIYHQRHPYRNDTILSHKRTNHTRFITLSDVGNRSSQKWAYLFGMNLKKVERCDIQTECPYTVSLFKEAAVASGDRNGSGSSDHTNASFRWTSSNDDSCQDSPQNKRRRPNIQQRERECWFCLKTEACEKHLIVYVNDSSTFYVALAKGAIHPEHVLIVPVDHHKSAATLPDDLDEDLDTLKTQLYKFFEKKGKNCVIFERSYSQMHFVLQVVPVRKEASKSLLSAFHTHANEIKAIAVELIEAPETLKTTWVNNHRCNYFHAEFPSGEEFFIPLHIPNFPINFGRQFLCDARVLNCPQAADWRNCIMTKDEEEANRDTLKSAFAAFLDEYNVD